MPSLKIFVLFGVVFGPTIIQGKYCPRTNKEAGEICATECAVFIGCPGVKDSNCICDGDCGYSCVKKGLRCPKIRRPRNGQRVLDGRYFNDTATFTCDPGYTLSGSSVRTCRGGGTWDGVEPKCGTKCDDPGVGNDTLRREPIRNSSGFLTSEVLHYYCNAEYLIEGKDIIACQAGGTWDSSRPQCYRTSCPPPTLPANSNVYRPEWFNTSQGARNGRQIYLMCNPGYYKVGSSSIMACSGEQWQLPTSFKCSPVNCGDPGTPRDGGKNGLVYHFKSKVEFYCNQCYKLIGAAYRYCNADQAWSGQQPTCHRVQTRCKDISHIGNGWVRQTSTECGGTTKFSCYRYYNLIGSSQIICRDNGTWSATTPYCEPVTCPKFNASKGIHANFSGYQYGSTVKFSCKDPNSVLFGKNSGSCNENGEWSAKVPECLAVTCPKFNASKGIHANFSGYQYGSTVKFSCKDPNSVLFGKNSSSCNENGEWSAKVPECLAIDCGDPGTPRNGYKNGLVYHFKSTVEFYCNKCYKLIGAAYRYCNADQKWSGQQPICQRVQTRCEDIPRYIKNRWVNLTSTNCGGTAEFSCDRYYNLVGSPRIICRDNGTWSARHPYCKHYPDKKTPATSSSGLSNLQLIIIIICVILLIVFLVVIFLLYRRRGLCFGKIKQQNKTETNIHVELQNKTLQEPKYDNIDDNVGNPLCASVGGNVDDTEPVVSC